jgi:hypothetical protein
VLDTAVLFLNGGTAYDFGTSVFNNITITNQFLKGDTPSTNFIVGDIDSGNVAVGGLASVLNNRVDPTITSLTGASVDDVRWNFSLNDDIPDTRPDSLLDVQGNATETTITTVNTPVKVNAVWADEGSSQFTSSADGRATYLGEKGATLPITLAMSILATGGDKQVSGYIAVNGVEISGTGIQTTASGSKAGNVTCIWQQLLSQGDYVEAWVENNSGTDNVTVTQAVLRVN